MILLVTPSDRAAECATALHGATGEEVTVAESLPRAASLLRAGCYSAAVFDQYLLEAEPREAKDQRGPRAPARHGAPRAARAPGSGRSQLAHAHDREPCARRRRQLHAKAG